jgi:hypothetical protein
LDTSTWRAPTRFREHPSASMSDDAFYPFIDQSVI